ncbi:hypothetical protein NM208_g2643 [Fusarium decemcellulare]|uniref:Uncharacterized protein n=1 Tax=Fusarium decemcellulare TaxID=57161 RepID=A0ACC1SRZ1_9HYPO|nr:hypothetical protein NM208_g2643 [Fusarium decemcellulare]
MICDELVSADGADVGIFGHRLTTSAVLLRPHLELDVGIYLCLLPSSPVLHDWECLQSNSCDASNSSWRQSWVRSVDLRMTGGPDGGYRCDDDDEGEGTPNGRTDDK